MTESDLKDAFKKAAEIAKVVPEPMQNAAFHRALDEVLGTSQTGGKRRRSRSGGGGQGQKPKPSNPKKGGRKPGGGRVGPKAAVEGLIDGGFFKEGRRIAEIAKTLEVKTAHKYKSSDLSPTLGRLVREGRLSRVKNPEGKYEYHAGSG